MLAAVAAAAVAAPTAACEGEVDCSLNGACVGGACRCDRGWGGERCAELRLAAVDPATLGYRNGSMPTWYGSVIEEDGAFHMFTVARAVQVGPPLDDYFENSAVARVEGPSPAGPFSFKEWAIPRFAHEAHAVRAPDGTVLIFGVTGAGADVPMWPTTECELLYNGSFPFAALALTLSSAPSVRGPWTTRTLFRFHAGRADDPFCRMEAPTVAFAPDGGVVMVFNAFPCAPVAWQPGLDHVYLATAPRWDGEYTRHDELGPLIRTCAGCGAEDPFVWRSARGYHMLLHSLGDGGGQAVGGVAFSKDARNWTLNPRTVAPPYPDSVKWTNGTQSAFHRRQAPSLILDADGLPTHLITGVDYADFSGCHWRTAWTLTQPVAP